MFNGTHDADFFLSPFFYPPVFPLNCPHIAHTDNDRLLSNRENRTPSVIFSTQVEGIRNINSVSISEFPYFLSLFFLRWRPDTGGRALFEFSEELRCCTLSSTVLKMEDCCQDRGGVGSVSYTCLGQWMKRLDKKTRHPLTLFNTIFLGSFRIGILLLSGHPFNTFIEVVLRRFALSRVGALYEIIC